MAAGGGKRAIIAALLANISISIAKFVGFIFTHSSALLAESVHSVADSSNQLLLLLGVQRSSRPATKKHPFGYGRERYFWSFVVAVVLFKNMIRNLKRLSNSKFCNSCLFFNFTYSSISNNFINLSLSFG